MKACGVRMHWSGKKMGPARTGHRFEGRMNRQGWGTLCCHYCPGGRCQINRAASESPQLHRFVSWRICGLKWR